MLELAPKIKSVHGEKIAIISEVSEIQTHRTVIFENEELKNIQHSQIYIT